ncbi:hypothetical protein BDEG_26138 [Batrachochytrium dendrobatidis JEL423]|uniref:ABC transporter domain-containing protein n=1 Tax=Batrachochytrium dendrobatidis (strain JEL423) TaxID=403673 RepID=A0A177WRI0_BATDL|nr:hypothetical protein BDEG_26138 [Batrachochytrium dendrobatidis JEL423]
MVNFTVDHLSKKLSSGVNLFDGLCIQVDDCNGPFVLAVRGASELIPYDSGSVYLNSKKSVEYGIPQWRSRVLYVPQRPPLLDGSPRNFIDTISKFQAQRDRLVDGPLDPIEISQKSVLNCHWSINKIPWNQLSGGELQRVAIALGVSRKPDILLLDEPTSALDPETCRLVEASLTKLNCIWITHDPAQEARVATDRIVLGALGSSSMSFFNESNTPAS